MSESSEGAAGGGPSHRSVELGVAVVIGIFSLIVIYGSILAGIGWGIEGPKAGFFPFYIGLLILIASIVNFTLVFSTGARAQVFAEWGQLRQVLAVVVPTAIYVVAVPWIGIYVSSMLLIGLFMKWLGRYGWVLVVTVSVGLPLAIFIVFERWFLVPLPKGPVENLLGF